MDKVAIITRPTRLDSLVAKFNTKQQAKFYVQHLNADFSDYETEHDQYYKTLDLLLKKVQGKIKHHVIEWKYIPNYLFGKDDLVITVGQDGLIANTLKYLDEQKVIGVNPDRKRWDGVLSQFTIDEIDQALANVMDKKDRVKKVTKAKVELSDSQVLYAVNDFFIGVKNHSSARYSIRLGKEVENQSSSGVIVSTPLGRSGWMKSVMAGATGITNKIADKKLILKEQNESDWGQNKLMFAVREPFPSISTQAKLIFGAISKDTEFSIESKMGENGLIFSDGMQEDFLEFNYSVVARISIAETKGNIVINTT